MYIFKGNCCNRFALKTATTKNAGGELPPTLELIVLCWKENNMVNLRQSNIDSTKKYLTKVDPNEST